MQSVFMTNTRQTVLFGAPPCPGPFHLNGCKSGHGRRLWPHRSKPRDGPIRCGRLALRIFDCPWVSPFPISMVARPDCCFPLF